MVACDKCDDWFHVGSCVDKSDIERKKKWYCCNCFLVCFFSIVLKFLLLK